MQKITFISVFILTISFLYTGSPFDLTGQIRHRYEISDKDFNSSTGADSYSYLRTRLNLGFSPDENMKVFLQFQDSRKFGEEGSTMDGSAGSLDLHQGFVTVKNFFNFPISLKLGRYEVIYGPQRLMGAVGWHNVGRSFDGFTATYHHPLADVDLFNLKVTETGSENDNGDVWVRGVYGKLNLENYKTQAFLIQDDERVTYGAYGAGNIMDNLSHETEFAMQGGTLDDVDLKGLFYAFNLTYDLGMFKITGGYEHLSGDDPETLNENETFNTLYATNHKYYGFMDYFPAGAGSLGLNDLHLKLSGFEISGVKLNAAYHIFTSEFESAGKSDFGNELDLTCVKRYNENISFIGGYSMFTKGGLDISSYPGADNSSWFYLMTAVNF
ncbi:MAG: alginate export family protein [Fidelibacterota bacterium]